MSATVKLDYVRFVKRVSNGASLSKYGYIGMMQANAEALKAAPWVEARAAKADVTLTTNQLTKTDGVFNNETAQWTTPPTYTAYMDDKYDCFNQAGDAVARNATMCGYAGCVAYRFKMPSGPSGNVLETVKLAIQRDRYLRAGVRVRVGGSNNATPGGDWSNTVRGDNASTAFRSAVTAPAEGVVGVSSFGFLGQPDVPYLTASRAAADTITFDVNPDIAVSVPYFWVYLTLEDPVGYWDMYKEGTPRQYYIEGSAMLVAEQCEFTFASEPSSSSSSDSLVICSANYGTGTLWNVLPSDASESDVATGEFRKHAYVATDVYIPDAVWEMSDYTLTRDFAVGYGEDGTIVGQPFNPSARESISLYSMIRAAYSGFFEGKMLRCRGGEFSSEIDDTPAAAFFVGRKINDQVTSYHPNPGTVYISRKKLLIPFILTGTGINSIKPKRITMNWNINHSYVVINPTYENGMRFGPSEMQFNVWIALGSNITNYALNTLQRKELWTAAVSDVGEFKLIGSFFRRYTAENHLDVSSTETDTQSLPINFDIPLDVPHTMLFTVYIPNCFTYGVVTGSGGYNILYERGLAACRESSSQRQDLGGVTRQEYCAYFDKGVLNYGWSPEVTFTA